MDHSFSTVLSDFPVDSSSLFVYLQDNLEFASLFSHLLSDEALKRELKWDLSWLDGWPSTPHKKRVEDFLWNTKNELTDIERGKIWIKLSLAEGKLKTSLYKNLLEKAAARSPIISRQISVDIGRSFPNEEIKSAIDNSIKRAQLESVLTAYSVFNPKVQYVQGMNYIVALLLMHMGPEDSFFVLMSIMNYYGIANLCDIAMLNNHFLVFGRLLEVFQPYVYNQLTRLGVRDSFLLEFFISLFVYNLPVTTVVKVWDLFFLHGQEMIFRIGIAIFSLPPFTTTEFWSIEEDVIMRTIRSEMKKIDCEKLISKASTIILPQAILDYLKATGNSIKSVT